MTLHDVECRTHSGEPFNLRALRGQVLLVVNVASKCGFTPQLAELEALYREHRERGFTVLGFPCNQFARQSPESAEQFCAFGEREFGVTFPLMEKVEVNGAKAHPLFKRLKAEAPGWMGTRAIKWNFTKFLVDDQGRVLKRYAPTTKPEELRADIEALLP